MKVWTNKHFEGHWPVGTAAVVVAEDKQSAAELLNQKLLEHGLKPTADPEQFELLPTKRAMAVVLCDGNY